MIRRCRAGVSSNGIRTRTAASVNRFICRNLQWNILLYSRKVCQNQCGDNMSRSEKSTSKYISLILRHKPEIIGIHLDEHGWANVDELIAGIAKTQPFDMTLLEKIVAEDEKQRYSFNEDKTLIRANQGHSVPVDVELQNTVPPDILWHGTGEKYTDAIDREGLIPKSRLYVHLSSDPDTAVKVGSRHGRSVVYEVNARQMHEDGYDFFLSVNKVWLTKKVPAIYLCKLKDNH